MVETFIKVSWGFSRECMSLKWPCGALSCFSLLLFIMFFASSLTQLSHASRSMSLEQGAIKPRHSRLLKSALKHDISTSQLSDMWTPLETKVGDLVLNVEVNHIDLLQKITLSLRIFLEVDAAVKAKQMKADVNEYLKVYRVAGATTLITLCATVPGYWFTVAFIDYLGRLFIQVMGFFFMSVFMFALAFPHWTREENQKGFLVMYSLTFFFANFGPNSTTFIFPAEILPARLRSTCHGISAAAGKAGATIGVLRFSFVAQSQKALFILGGINLVGVLFTFLLPEPKGKSLEELSGEWNKDDAERGDQAT